MNNNKIIITDSKQINGVKKIDSRIYYEDSYNLEGCIKLNYNILDMNKSGINMNIVREEMYTLYNKDIIPFKIYSQPQSHIIQLINSRALMFLKDKRQYSDTYNNQQLFFLVNESIYIPECIEFAIASFDNQTTVIIKSNQISRNAIKIGNYIGFDFDEYKTSDEELIKYIDIEALNKQY